MDKKTKSILTPAEFTEGLNSLGRKQATINVDAVIEFFQENPIDASTLAPWINFSKNTYTRNKVLVVGGAEVLVMCWDVAQRSPIHDHGTSWCVVNVIEGGGVETIFDKLERPDQVAVRAVQKRSLIPGKYSVSYGDDIHTIENSGDVPMISVHIYNPPLVDHIFYPADDEDMAAGNG